MHLELVRRCLFIYAGVVSYGKLGNQHVVFFFFFVLFYFIMSIWMAFCVCYILGW